MSGNRKRKASPQNDGPSSKKMAGGGCFLFNFFKRKTKFLKRKFLFFQKDPSLRKENRR